jgi:hypothetical protein
MPTLDSVCFYGKDESLINFMSATTLEKLPFDKAKSKMRELMVRLPKLRYTVINVMGDLYYKPIDSEQALEYTV